MQHARRRIAVTLTWLAGLISMLVALAFPLVYFVAAYSGMAGTLQARVEGFAIAVNRLVSAAPDLWQYQHFRLEVQLQRLVTPASGEHARILDAQGQVLVEAGEPSPPPVMTRSAVLYDSGIPVGRIEVRDTLRDLMLGTTVAGIVGMLLAAGVFFTLRLLPLRALNRALDEVEAGRLMLMAAERIARMGSWEYEPSSRKLTWSDHLFQLLGFAPPAVPTLRAFYARVRREDRGPVRRATCAWRSGKIVYNLEFRFRMPGGDERTLLAQCEPSHGAEGTVQRLRGTVLDITEQKRVQEEIRLLNDELEARVKDRTSELEHTVSELEAFSYSVAHDLRAPIRSINNFSHLLLRSPGTALDEAGRRYTDRIIAASGRMAALIDGLLELARVNRAGLRLATVDLSGMARAIMDAMAKADPRRRVHFEIDSGLTATADAALMRTALLNLLDNAWKFTAHASDPHIEFRRVEDGGRPVFVIRDNGAGFDMRYAHKLFGTFQRLHHAEEYPGTGIGLVMVHRIIARHGGSVRVISEIGKGTEVYFTV